jgi:hypothetical protein
MKFETTNNFLKTHELILDGLYKLQMLINDHNFSSSQAPSLIF